MLVLHHLQLRHAQHQHTRQQKDHEAGRDHPIADDTGLLGDVLYGVKRLHDKFDNK